MTKQQINALKHYFASYTDSSECHRTSNDMLFHKETDAEAHAVTLQDKKIESFTRADVAAMTTGNNDSDKNSETKFKLTKTSDEKEKGSASKGDKSTKDKSGHDKEKTKKEKSVGLTVDKLVTDDVVINTNVNPEAITDAVLDIIKSGSAIE